MLKTLNLANNKTKENNLERYDRSYNKTIKKETIILKYIKRLQIYFNKLINISYLD